MSVLVPEFLSENKTVMVSFIKYVPLCLFPLSENENNFVSIEDIKQKSLIGLKAIPESAFYKCFKD